MARARNVFVVFVALLCSATFAVGNDRSNSISFPTSDEENVFSSRKLLATGSKSKKKGSSSRKSKEEVAKPQSKFQRAKAIKEKEKKMKKDGDKWDVGDVGDVGAKTQSKFQRAKAAKEEKKVEMERTNAMREEITGAFQAAKEKVEIKQQLQAKVDAQHQREVQGERAMHMKQEMNSRLRAEAAAKVTTIINGIDTSKILPFDPAKAAHNPTRRAEVDVASAHAHLHGPRSERNA